MKIFTSLPRRLGLLCILFLCFQSTITYSQTLSFPGAEGFGRYAAGARASSTKEVYIVTNLNDSGAGSFRDAVSKSGRIVVFAVGGIIKLSSDVSVAANITIAGQTAPGDGIVISNKRVTFTSANNTICRFLRLRLGATGNSGKDVSGLASGANMIFDHMSFAWAMDEVFSINWDGKGTSPDNITIQNSIIGQGLHRENHSAGGLIQTPDGGKVSLIKNLYISNKTRNPKVKGVNEFVNNVVYNWGNGDRLGDELNYGWSGDAYIMGGSSGISEVNIINNYFVGGPLTPPNKNSPFSRGTGTFNIYGSGNYFDNNKNGILDGTEVPYDGSAYGYPGITEEAFKSQPYAYPAANPTLTAEQAYQHIIDNVGATYPHRDELDAFMVDEVASKGIKGFYVYRETDLPLSNAGLGNVFGAPAPLDTDNDGMPDAWEDANGLNKNSKDDAVAMSSSHSGYLNIEVYINELAVSTPTSFLRPPSNFLAKTITPTSISLEWKDNSDSESNFILERSINGTLFTIVDSLDANTISFTDFNLESNKTYYYRLKGLNATESSSYVTLTTKTLTAPSAPSVPNSSVPLNNAFGIEAINQNLSWAGSSNTLSYKIYFGTDSSQLEYKGEQTATVFPITGLQENTFYYWRIDAINNLGLTVGDIWSFKTLKNYPLGIIGDWRFDENFGTVAADSSIYRNDAEINDVPEYEWEAGKINNGINLKTMTSAAGILVPHEEYLFLDKGSFSISLWVKAPAQSAVSKYIFHKGTFAKNVAAGTTGKWFGLELKDGNLYFSVDDDVTKSTATINNSTFFNGNWTHIVVVRDVTSKKLRIYRNGFLAVESADNTTGGIGGDEPLVIANTNSFNAPFAGSLDEFKVLNYPLSDNEILKLYHTSPLPLPAYSQSPENNSVTTTSHLVNVNWKGGINTTSYKVYFGDSINNLTYKADVLLANPSYQFFGLEPNTSYYWRVDAVGPAGITVGEIWSFKTPFQQGVMADWKLDATSGISIIDQSIYQTHGELRNISNYTWEEGRINNALNLKTVNTNSTIRIPSKENIVFDKNSFSISLWVKADKPAVATTSAYLLFKGSFAKNVAAGTTGKWYGVELKNNNISLNVDDDVVKSAVTMSSNTFLNNTWVNIVFVRDVVAKKLRIYRNGVLAVEGNDNTGIINGIGGIEPLYIANSNDLNTPFKGILDEIKMFNYALSPSEIAGLASAKDAQSLYFSTLEAKKTTDEDFNAEAVSSSGLNVTYTSSNSDVATIIDGKIHLVGAGTSIITAFQEGNVNYLAAIPVSQVLSVTKTEQSITFNSLAPVRIGDGDIQLDATSSSGLSVTYISSNENVAKIIDGNLKILNHGSTIITALQDGNEIYLATSASRELIVKPYHVQVLYQDGDNGQKTNNTIKPFLKIANQDSIAIAYKELTLRYWITAENFAGINTWIDYAQLGNNKVSMKYVSLSKALNGALGYIEYSFNDQFISLDPGKNSGVIQSRLSNKDYALLNESDDYSYQQGNVYAVNNNITLYRNGSLIWGIEPAAVDSILKVKVLYANKNNNSNSNSISTTLTINNEGNFPISYGDLSIRYWFTSEGSSALNYWIDYAKLGSSKFSAQFVKPSSTFIGADTYFELKPKSELGLFYPLSNTGVIDYRIAKSNWSVFNESDDYSFSPKAALAENNHITVYYKNQLIYGVEPIEIPANTSTISEKQISGFDKISNGISKEDGVITYPNPSRGNFKVEVNTEENGNINISVFNSVGELVQNVKDIKNGIYQKEFSLINLVPGTYYIKVKINGFVKTKAIIVY